MLAAARSGSRSIGRIRHVARSASGWSCIHGATGRCRCSARSSRCRAVPATRPGGTATFISTCSGRCSVGISSCWWTTGGPVTRARSTVRSCSPTGGTTCNAGACGRQLGATAADYGTADAAERSPGRRGHGARHRPDRSLRRFVRDVLRPGVRGAAPRSASLARARQRLSGRRPRSLVPGHEPRAAGRVPSSVRSRSGLRRGPGWADQADGRLAASLRRHPIVGTAFDADGVLVMSRSTRAR